jgi:hypothetical protein
MANGLDSGIKISFFGLSRDEASPALDELAQVFPGITIEEKPTPPAASPLFSELSVLLLAFSVAAQGFLGELGKDAYAGLRSALLSAMKKAKRVRDNRGGYVFGVLVQRTDSYVVFQCSEPPSPAAFEKALKEIPALIESVPAGEFAEFTFDAAREAWSEPYLAPEEFKQHLRRGRS